MKHLFNLKLLGLMVLGSGLLAQVSNRPSDQVVTQALQKSEKGKNLLAEDLSFELTDFHSSKQSGAQHIYLRQTFNGIEIIGTESSIHILGTGEVSSVKSSFLNSLEKRGHKASASPQINAVQAANAAFVHLGYTASTPISVVSQEFTPNHKTTLSNGGFAKRNIPAELAYVINEEGNLVLAWTLSIDAMQKSEYYEVRVNAATGQIINKGSYVNTCEFGHVHEENSDDHWQYHTVSKEDKNENLLLTGAYRVFAMPLESPYYGTRTLVSADDAVNLTASPFGWHDTNGSSGPEYTTTRGNNVNAYEDGNNPGFQPNAGAPLVFDYPFDQNYSTATPYEEAAITNLFYWNNIIHDVMYQYGFDEASGNFQENNYGNGGAGGDSVNAEAQDGSGTCNANFGTPSDGGNPTMQMYVCGNKDGDFDNLVIVHEYGHGISNRLTGGPSQSGCLWNGEQMGEGWSDWYGLMFTMDADDEGTDGRGIGTYLFGEGPNGDGIRTYKYSTDMSINPHTYDDIKTVFGPHPIGSVWCAMLWDLTWALIDEYGYDEDIYNGTGGNNIAMQLVTEGLKLQPCSPGFVDGRDAILEADQILYGGANQCLIWDVFARRGLGVSASQGSSSSNTDGTEAFDTPSSVAEFSAPGDVCIDVDVMTGLSGGSPFGGVYSGPGVTDDGNGTTYTFNPQTAGVGVHTITYAVPATDCAPASSDTDQIEVTEGLMVDCPDDIVVNTSGSSCSAIVNYTTPVGMTTCAFTNGENFDMAGVPNLPDGWTTTNETGGSNPWVTSSAQSSSTPNSAFGVDVSSVSLNSLVSPVFEIDSQNAKLFFDIYYNTETGYDGAVLEYSTNNGSSWSDILSGGGTFVTGAYNDDLSTGWQNPLPGRNAWSGNSNGFIPVEINLSSSFDGQDLMFRWRMGCDSVGSATGVWIDNIEVEGVFIPTPVVTQTAGLPSGSEFPVGTTTNTFEVNDGTSTAVCSFDVTVNDGVDPEINCPADATVEVEIGETYTLPDYWADGDVTATDNCSAVSNQTQSPAAGTELGIGVHTIEFTVQDSSGNTATCSFELTVDELMGTGDLGMNNLISLYPNPADNQVIISNQTKQSIVKVVILDMSGKMIKEIGLNNALVENPISINHLPSGTYMIQIIGEKQTVIKKLVKK
ncbi:M36 family metallopeptidase [Moheibacter lacus]|nr:M36 family metallopeptidase [Moheibacter lacus]